jgi:hypothetical protein
MNFLAGAKKQAPVIKCCQWLVLLAVSSVADGLLILQGLLLVKMLSLMRESIPTNNVRRDVGLSE